MRDLANNATVQEAACVALATICRQQEAETSQDLMKKSEGAVSTLLSCMTRYPNNPCIQSKAFAAITNLCIGSQKSLAELSKTNGIMTLTMALQMPWENKNDQHEAISNLSIVLRGIAELNEDISLSKTEEEIMKGTKQDGTSRTSSDTESMSTKVDDNNINVNENESIRTNGNSMDDDGVSSYMEEIPNLPVITSSMSHDVEEIPDLGQFSTMMSNLEWQIDSNDLNSQDKKSAVMVSPGVSNEIWVGTHQRENGEGNEEEKCIIQ